MQDIIGDGIIIWRESYELEKDTKHFLMKDFDNTFYIEYETNNNSEL